MTIHIYPEDFSEDDWSDLPSLSAGDVVDGNGHTFTSVLIIPTAGCLWRNFEVDVGGLDSNAIAISSMDNTTLQDVTFGGSTADGLTQGNPALSVDSLTLINVIGKDNAQDGFQLGHPTGGGCTNLVIRNVTSLRNGHTGMVLNNSPNADLDGITIIDCGSTGNLDGLAVNDGCGGTIIKNVVVKGQKSGQSVDIQDSTDSVEIKLSNAHVSTPNGAGIIDGIAVTGSAPALVYNCIVEDHRYNYLAKSLVDHRFYNIVSANATAHGVRVGLGGADGNVTLKNALIYGSAINNIRVQEDGTTSSTLTADYNLYDESSGYYWKTSVTDNIEDWRTDSSEDDNSMEVADLKVGSDFKTTFSSDGYRSGTYVTGFHDTYKNGNDSWGDIVSIGLDDNGLSWREHKLKRSVRKA